MTTKHFVNNQEVNQETYLAQLDYCYIQAFSFDICHDGTAGDLSKNLLIYNRYLNVERGDIEHDPGSVLSMEISAEDLLRVCASEVAQNN